MISKAHFSILQLCANFLNLELEHSPTPKTLRRWKKPMPVIVSSTKRTFNSCFCVSVCVCESVCVGGWVCRNKNPELMEKKNKLYPNPIRLRA